MAAPEVRRADGPPVASGQEQPPPLDRWVVRRIRIVWTLLFFNTLPWAGDPGRSPLVLPKIAEQAATAIMVVAAFYLAITLNRRLRLRPYPYFVFYGLLALTSFVGSLTGEAGLGGPARAARLGLWLFTLWLLSPYWPDPGRVCFRAHQLALKLLLVAVIIELPLFGRTAYTREGRLGGVLPVLAPPAVGQYAALMLGLSVIQLIFSPLDEPRRKRRRLWGWIVFSIVMILLSHTRTAVLSVLVALGVALILHALRNRRARRVLGVAALVVPLIVVSFGSAAETWFRRGQSTQEIAELTGRTSVWELLLAAERGPATRVFGTGLSDKTFDGRPIDSGWLSIYQESGLLGVSLVVGVFVWLLMRALLRPADLARALSVFLTVFCLMSSYTDVGIGDASPTMLHLAAAGSLAVAAISDAGHIRFRRRPAAHRTPSPNGSIGPPPLYNPEPLR